MSRSARITTFGVYLLVVFEILYMISPFALHFYAVYGQAFALLNSSPATAWLTGFFLPHVSRLTDPLLTALHAASRYLIVSGLALFVVGFVQIYGSKLLRRGPVMGGIYRWIRHPQYMALAIAGLGMALEWPRFLIALTYAAMLALYSVLARQEERQCLARFGEPYRAYLAHTSRFLPFVGQGSEPSPFRPLRAGFTVAVAVAATAFLTLALREYTLSRINAIYRDDVVIVSPAPIDRAHMETAFTRALAAAPGAARAGKLLVYVLPESWMLADLPMDDLSIAQWKVTDGHHAPADFDTDRLKVLLARPLTYARDPRGKSLLRSAWGRRPVALVHLDLGTGAATLGKPPRHVLWTASCIVDLAAASELPRQHTRGRSAA